MTWGSFKIKAVLGTTKPEAAKRFYGDVLNLTFKSEHEFSVIFEGGGTVLHLHKVRSITPHAFTSLSFIVPDISFAVRELKNRGVEFDRHDGMNQDADGIWTTDGGKICWFKDPDGNVLSLVQET